MDTREDEGLTEEDKFEERLHEDVIYHGEDRTVQFMNSLEEEDLDENRAIEEGLRVDVIIEMPPSERESHLSSEVVSDDLSDDLLEELEPQFREVRSNNQRSIFWIPASVFSLFLIAVFCFIWIAPSQEAVVPSELSYPIDDEAIEDIPLPLEWWEDTNRCQSKIAQQVSFQKSLASFLVETSEGNGCICGALPSDPFEELPMLVVLDGRKFYDCTPKEVFGDL